MLGRLLGRSQLPEPRAALLDFISRDSNRVDRDIGEGGWQEIDRMAAMHRLRPLLHHVHRDNPAIPAGIRASWQDDYRASAMNALQMAAELRQVTSLLERAGLEPIALKGAWLAWHAYPHPALRPMRDLDLLLTPETVVAGMHLLQANGYQVLEESQLSPEETVRLEKHMPPLLSPRGVVIELHQRLAETDGKNDHAAPNLDEPGVRARARTFDGIRMMDPQDLLAHLIVHAVYDHRLDCGPLVLADIRYLLGSVTMDWAAVWQEAAAGRWERGAGLVLALVAERWPELGIALPAGLADLPEDARELASQLLLQDLDTRRSAGVFATFSAAGLGALAARLVARRRQPEGGTTTRDLSGERGFGAWALSRLGRTTRELARADVRQQSRGLARLSRWLDA